MFLGFAYMSTKLPHKDIKFTNYFNDLIMNNPTLFKGNYIGTCIQHPHKSNKVWLHTFLYISQNNLNAFYHSLHCICPNIMVVQVTTYWDGILLNTLQASSMLPHFAYISIKLFPTNINSKPPSDDWNSCKTAKIGKAHIGC